MIDHDNIPTPKIFTCSDCGFTWEQGQSGSHDCRIKMRTRINTLERELATVTKERDDERNECIRVCKDACQQAFTIAALRSEVTCLSQELACKLNEPLVLRAEVVNLKDACSMKNEAITAACDWMRSNTTTPIHALLRFCESRRELAAPAQSEPSQVGGNLLSKEMLDSCKSPETLRSELAAAQATIAELQIDIGEYEKIVTGIRAENTALRAERDNWESTAAQFHRNTEFYQGLVRQIGETFGVAARTANDGSVMENVLALKVPELVNDLRAQLATTIAERDEANEHARRSMEVGIKLKSKLDSALAACAAKDALVREAVAHWTERYGAELESCDKWEEWCKAQHDTHGMNFHQGMRSGLVSHDIALDKLKRALSSDAGSDYVPKAKIIPLWELGVMLVESSADREVNEAFLKALALIAPYLTTDSTGEEKV